MDELKHYSEVLDQHCEAEGRDPSTILRTIMSPVVLVADQTQAEATLAHLSPERRAHVKPATPAEAAEALKPYLDAGFGGFIFRNTTMLTPESVALAGELIGLMR
jgi:alkanesulfonate monooxygenase SsuD/methylene tetrahydromethanopterin reductase-like flavin-dependent oxidoreductase (luciferase family)